MGHLCRKQDKAIFKTSVAMVLKNISRRFKFKQFYKPNFAELVSFVNS